jgi:hypothetical protein
VGEGCWRGDPESERIHASFEAPWDRSDNAPDHRGAAEVTGDRRRGGGGWAVRGGKLQGREFEGGTDAGIKVEPRRPSPVEDPFGVRRAHEPKASNPPP